MAKKTVMAPEVAGYNVPEVHMVKLPLWPYLVAPLTCVGALLFAALVHHFYTQDVRSAGWSGFLLGVLGLLLLGFTALAARPRGLVMQIMAIGNAAIGLLWMAPAIINGPWSATMLGLWAAGLVFVSLISAVYRIMRMGRGDQPRIVEGEVGEMFDAVKSLKQVGRFGSPKVSGATVRQAIEMKPGETFASVAGDKANIASLFDVATTAVRTIGDPDSARRGELVATPVDQLKNPIPDPGLSAPGQSIARPIVLGHGEDGERVEIIVSGDPKVHRNAIGVMGVVGMSGSGKTVLLRRLCREVHSRYDAELHIADARKAGQLSESITRLAKSLHAGKDATLELLDSLERRVAQRAEQLGSRGFDQWVEGCGIPFEVYVVFEANAILKDSNIVDLSESVRSVGMLIVLESQRATWDRFPTSARSNVTTWVCLGVQRMDDCEAALSDSTIEAGAAPWEWKQAKPGYFYLEWSGRDKALWSSPCRGFEPPTTEDVPVPAPAAAPVAGVEPYTGDQPQPGRPEEPGEVPDDDEPAVKPGVNPDDPPPDTDPSKPIVVPPGFPDEPFDNDGEKMPPSHALAYLRAHIFDLWNAGKRQVRPQELSDIVATTGMGPWWVYKALNKLAEGPEACLRKTDRGYYKIDWPLPQPERGDNAA
jgi:hypothetical protein